jgi:hypothetical protein
MSEKTIRITRRYAELAFAFSQAARGPAGIPGVVVYGFAASFGLEYVSSVWTGRSARRQRRQLSS